MDTYTVLEVQNNSVLSYVYTDMNQALAKYYTVLAAAAVSQVSFHSACVLRGSDFVVINSQIFDRRQEPAAEA